MNSWETTYVTANTAYLLEDGSVTRGADPAKNPVCAMGGDGGLIRHRD